MCFIIFPWSKIISNCCFENILSLTIDKSADEISITIRLSEQKSYHFLPKSLEKFLMNRAASGSKIKLSLCTKIITLIKSNSIRTIGLIRKSDNQSDNNLVKQQFYLLYLVVFLERGCTKTAICKVTSEIDGDKII